MDPSSLNSFQLRDQSLPISSDQRMNNGPRFELIYSDQNLLNDPRLENSFVQHKFGPVGFISGDHLPTNVESRTDLGFEDGFSEDIDFSDAVLSYINRMLMEEDMEDKTDMLQESLELQAKEKSFYEALGKKYPPSPEQNVFTDRNSYFTGSVYSSTSNTGDSSGYLADNISTEYNSSYIENLSNRDTSYSSVCSSNSGNTIVDGFLESPVSSFHILNIYDESQSILNFQKGVEEASKFLPTSYKLLNSVDINDLPPRDPKGEADFVDAQVKEKDEGETSTTEARGKKNPLRGDNIIEEERSSKQAAVFTESTLRSEEFDIVLLNSMGKGGEALEAYRQDLRNAKSKNTLQMPKGSKGGKGRGKKQGGTKEVIDLRTLLINCAQAVAADDSRVAYELLKLIRQHSSPFGDGNQRLAHCFADGLEARLAGTGSQIYKALVNKRTSAADLLKAYHLYLASSPFRKISSFASNKTIMIKAENATRVHVIDFGILYGFQWPTFIQRIAEREGGPPKLRITGIEFPQPGFRPAERIEETGRRLADYARSFNVPFEYHAIAKKWETITVEDLKLDKDEFLAVNCLYRFKNLHDETIAVDSSRTIVLNLIRKINPDIFVHAIVNGAYSSPFFVTRFREALFHFSALFDMLETIVPREIPERGLIEREIFGREALNVIACEGWERVERPETYKQWQARILGARFTQIPFDREEFLNKAVEKVRLYHRDFLIDEDSQWLLLGWKGRTIFALSCWKPV
ncbi:Scarecrow-like protein 9 [Capsicum annuum]|uniref:Scarecrow-like protein 9 n=1 Tax=Capsicum annuum TaxID=4072 RepID=A0A2G2XVW4_CAPAN|nr:scarecrow-like protein 9 [Capsicum annuum]XP_047252702.1 scarecrow-like protein 9 [Capsicum annuum]XP_047252703.1 scarecrow-like protein 9 [Capsicum annuum]KAF3626847.1 Scarecrow-like protein 9 [Capsicum annuum]KAF3660023.1 Scarecrow-like protein 9 [Capsicum annuum]PHT61633.1 Scarecrow-like protein 9 [Capsicum annuum]